MSERLHAMGSHFGKVALAPRVRRRGTRFDKCTWRRVVRIVHAARDQEREVYRTELERAATLSVPLIRRTEVYLRILCSCQVRSLIDADDELVLVEFAQRIAPMANLAAKATWPMYLEALRQSLGQGRDEPFLDPLEIDVLCAAISGALLRETQQSARRFRRPLRRYLATHGHALEGL